MTDQRTRVLIVDDSAFARKVIREILERNPDIEVVGIARDGLDALERIQDLKPDVVTLDLVMPELDGIGVLRALAGAKTPKILIVSASAADSEQVFEALELGAIDVVTKPNTLPTDKLYDLSTELIRKVRAAAAATASTASAFHKFTPKKHVMSGALFKGTTQLVVLGTSTGGPQALTEIFKTLPQDFPVPLVVALHIPSGYTAPLAERISKSSLLPLVEAHDGMELKAGRAVIAPGGMHLTVKKIKGQLLASVSRTPVDSLYHPSIDLLFKSAADQLKADVMGVVLTGMGSDGTEGSAAIRKAGGRILAESADSCVVYGMPRSVIEKGLANGESVLSEMSALIVSTLYS